MTRPQISQSLSSVTSMGWKLLVFRPQEHAVAFLEDPLEREFIAEAGDDDRAVGAGDGPVDDQQVAVENARSPHGIAGRFDIKRRGGVADEMLVEVEACLPDNRRRARGIRRTRENDASGRASLSSKLGGSNVSVAVSCMDLSVRGIGRQYTPDQVLGKVGAGGVSVEIHTSRTLEQGPLRVTGVNDSCRVRDRFGVVGAKPYNHRRQR